MQRVQVILLLVVLVAVVALVVAKGYVGRDAPEGVPESGGLPRLLEVGAKGCDACNHMEPIIAVLTGELKGKVEVVVVNVIEDPAAIDRYRLKTIPVQVFEDAQGKELWRNTGTMERGAILAKLRELRMM